MIRRKPGSSPPELTEIPAPIQALLAADLEGFRSIDGIKLLRAALEASGVEIPGADFVADGTARRHLRLAATEKLLMQIPDREIMYGNTTIIQKLYDIMKVATEALEDPIIAAAFVMPGVVEEAAEE